jgi:hypothetical protein
MKTFLNTFKEWIYIWVWILVTLSIWVFAYNQTYTTIPVVSSWSILSADIFNQILANMEDLNERVNMLSWQVYDSYSFEEQWTGNYWIDGKKIYKKTIYIESLPDNTNLYVYHNIINIKNVVKANGFWFDGDGVWAYFPIPYVNPQNHSSDVSIVIYSDKIDFITARNRIISYAYITLEYTCTDR